MVDGRERVRLMDGLRRETELDRPRLAPPLPRGMPRPWASETSETATSAARRWNVYRMVSPHRLCYSPAGARTTVISGPEAK